jgi:UDP:flavonoid glycosyltransferase YjiC (YdhE family)
LRIAIPITGSRGDIQPFVALGMGLQTEGHEVCLATHADFSDFIRNRGLEFFPIVNGARVLHETEAGQRMIHAGTNPLLFIREYARLREPLMCDLIHGCWRACRDADLILIPTTALLPGLAAAEKLRLPIILASLQPAIPTRFLVNCLVPRWPGWLPLGGLYNLLSHYLVAEWFWQLQRETVNRARREVLGLPPLPLWGLSPQLFSETPSLHGYSPTVIPKPPDWRANHRLTGFWFLQTRRDWQPPAALVQFLEAGSPPVCIGFGSMQNANAQETTELVVQALARAGRRGILVTGWGGLGTVRPSADIFVIEAVPYDWLFPYTAAVVHHGGVGTTAAALRAGVPSVIVPFMADQPFWGRRVFELGAGPKPIPRSRLTVDRLADALRVAVEDKAMRTQAAAIGRQIRTEDGVGLAVEAIHEWHRSLPGPHRERHPWRTNRSRPSIMAY